MSYTPTPPVIEPKRVWRQMAGATPEEQIRALFQNQADIYDFMNGLSPTSGGGSSAPTDGSTWAFFMAHSV